ncbi:MAG: KH domain-containing protein [Nanoarchaeota archaeon]|nr:KH domain-containing protein [Nanoarchaeota archaeon]
MNNEINETQDYAEVDSKDVPRKIIIPGEVIVTGEDYLPGEGTRREGNSIVAIRFGLAEEMGRVVRVIPIFGAFIPRRNNVIIGRVIDITYAGWLVDIDSASNAFLSIEESPRFINRDEMDQFLAIGEVIAAKIWGIKGKGIDLTLKAKGLGKLEEGFTFRIIPSRVPRVIGREGSMVSLIKEKTGCNIIVGQNGWIWIHGPSLDAQIKARRAIEFVADKVFVSGLTEKVEKWFEEGQK